MKKENGVLNKVIFTLLVILSLIVDGWFIYSMIIKNSFAEMKTYAWELVFVAVLIILFCAIAKIRFKEKVRYILSLFVAFSIALFNLFAASRLIKMILSSPSKEPWMLVLQLLALPYCVLQILFLPVFINKILNLLMKKGDINY